LAAIDQMITRAFLFGIFVVTSLTACPAQQAETADLPADSATEYTIRRNLVYKKAEHRLLRGDLYVPKAEGTYPAVLLLHGGGWKAGSKKQMIYHAKRLAPNGYVAFAIDYRLAPRYKFPTQFEDCRDAIRFLREHASGFKIDPQRIAAFGYSAGGHLACLLGTVEEPVKAEDALTSRVQAVVAGGAPCDFEIVPADADLLAYWLGGSRVELPAVYRAASPIKAVSPDDAPTLFYHGERDTLVPSFSAKRMMQRLAESGVRTEFHVCERKGHYRAFLDSGAFEKALAFLDRELKP
jgi:triacylglycerol lipase